MFVTRDTATFVRFKKEKSSDCGESGSKRCKQGHGSAYGVAWRSLRLVGVSSLKLGCPFFWVRTFGRNLAFKFTLLYKETSYIL